VTTMPEQIEQLRRQWTDQYVVVQGDRPELARFRGAVGRVKTVNHSGRALVEFDADNNRGWYDIEVDYLQVVDKPAPKVAEKKPAPKPAAKPVPPKPAEGSGEPPATA